MYNYELVPQHMLHAIRRYIEEGKRPGEFLTALLENDLMRAVSRADDTNLAALRDWTIFMHNEMPVGSHGSPENVKRWIKHGGLATSRAA